MSGAGRIGPPTPDCLDPAKMACWYFRLNGFLQVENFIVHPRHRGGQVIAQVKTGQRCPSPTRGAFGM